MPHLKRWPIWILLLILFTGYACRKIPTDVTVLDDFETPPVSDRWKGTFSLSNDFPAHGKRCLELDASDGEALWLESEELTQDWSDFDYLKFDIYNPSPQLHYGYIEICDELGTDEQAEFHGQSYNWQNVFLNTGWNRFEVLLQNAMVSEGDRPLALDRIRKFRLSFRAMDHSLFIDNIRLVKGEESPRTASRIDPRDCKITIDDR